MYELAAKFKISYIISGTNIVTEQILPNSWVFKKLDYTNLKAIHKKFGNIKLKTYPRVPFYKMVKYAGINKLVPFSILDYVDYNKKDVIEVIKKELDWRDYGGKHCESLWTKFYQNYILPEKFGVDKRKAHLSTLICSGQMKREEALSILNTAPYDAEELKNDKPYILKKLGLSEQAFEDIMKTAPIPHKHYGTDVSKREKYMELTRKTQGFRKFLKS